MNKHMQNVRIEIVTHFLVWLVLLCLPYTFTVAMGKSWSDLVFFFWTQILFMAVIFYVNYLFAVKQLLFSDKKVLFYLLNFLLVLLLIWIRHQIIVFGLPPRNDAGRPNDGPPIISQIYIESLVYLIPIAFAVSIQSGKRLIKMDTLKQESDNIKLQAELKHLKYQLQPHFFFNSLNNIYALVDADPNKAKQTIHSLSKLMRHLLHNSDEEKILLAEEISFLNKYIDLMSLRQNAHVEIETHFPQQIPALEIAPLLFVSLVENAFKHGISATKQSWLYFEIKVENEKIIFLSKNYNFPKNKADMSGSGIGIDNLKKRLALLYENKHTLKTEMINDRFEVMLEIEV